MHNWRVRTKLTVICSAHLLHTAFPRRKLRTIVSSRKQFYSLTHSGRERSVMSCHFLLHYSTRAALTDSTVLYNRFVSTNVRGHLRSLQFNAMSVSFPCRSRLGLHRLYCLPLARPTCCCACHPICWRNYTAVTHPPCCSLARRLLQYCTSRVG